MIRASDNVYVVESVSELPEFRNCVEVFEDVETTAFEKKRYGNYPWRGDRICGLAVTVDDCPIAYYVPVRHELLGSKNLPIDAVVRWQKDLLRPGREWINHNVKFDAHFVAAEGVEIPCDLICTLTLAKIHDTDFGRYGQEVLCRRWLGMDTSYKLDVDTYLKSTKSKDMAEVPVDLLARRAGFDVLGSRALYRFLCEHKYEGAPWETEIELTKMLWEMESVGLRISPSTVKQELVRTMRNLILLSDDISEKSGREFTNSKDWVYDYLVNANGLPVLAYHEKTGRPTFNKRALRLYESYCVGELKEVVKKIREFRVDAQYKGLFLDPFLELVADDRIHPRYNQIVRTGRMSSSGPNIQQQNKRSKKLVLPDPGRCFIAVDYSQIEFRLIAHYAQDADVIRAYNEDPNTDFHKFVATLLYDVPLDKVTKELRSPAKTMNFGMGYGMGQRKATSSVKADPAIIREVQEKLKDVPMSDVERRRLFDELTDKRAVEVYNTYHEKMPGIRRVSRDADRICRQRGYVFNAYGRRRHLRKDDSRKAFNSVVQGGAMDIIKERMLACRRDDFLRSNDVRVAINVHDEVVFDAPKDHDPAVRTRIFEILENPSAKFRVPIRVDMGISAKDWSSCEPVSHPADSHPTSVVQHVGGSAS